MVNEKRNERSQQREIEHVLLKCFDEKGRIEFLGSYSSTQGQEVFRWKKVEPTCGASTQGEV